MAAQPPTVNVADPGTAEETKFQSSHDGLEFRTRKWLPSTIASKPPRAAVVFVHGFIEHVGRYNHVFPSFAQANIYVVAFDQRGFGETWSKHKEAKKQHGNTTWKQQFEDLADLIKLQRKELDDKFGKDVVPIFLMGHSMGGGISFAFMTRDGTADGGPAQETKDMIKGVIMSSPWITLTHPPPGFLVPLLRGVLKIYPNMPWFAEVAPRELSKDPEVVKWTQEDPLCDGHVYLKAILGPITGGPTFLTEGYKRWPKDVPILVSHGDADPVTNPKASKELESKLDATDKEYKSWPGYLHEGWHEQGNEKVEYINYLVQWIVARTSEKPQES
ncbi:alpha/beta-hydrolase [Acaromyces ingoldii]|uniref:Alpha/beta-hydrolase n=1 Tax=Acaromyces ingoldii TaxID=215250 RepID=A0A316YD30_9BASI|nr:alpha/beta-hydrolase [Acaromyces ingoldii]PWN86578.1 alpha/beta-hydrolase [Acaromyces ingoldii]